MDRDLPIDGINELAARRDDQTAKAAHVVISTHEQLLPAAIPL